MWASRTPPLLANDPLAAGAATLSDHALLRCITGEGHEDECAQAATLLALDDAARLELLRELSIGPAVLAALELGRRAVLFPRHAALVVRSPTDAALLARPHLVGPPDALVALVLDSRGSVVRLKAFATSWSKLARADRAEIFGAVLAAGCRRLVLAAAVDPPVTDRVDRQRFSALARSARGVGIDLVDVVLIGALGLASMARQAPGSGVHGLAGRRGQPRRVDIGDR
jgi:DNA repair protein RadC